MTRLSFLRLARKGLRFYSIAAFVWTHVNWRVVIEIDWCGIWIRRGSFTRYITPISLFMNTSLPPSLPPSLKNVTISFNIALSSVKLSIPELICIRNTSTMNLLKSKGPQTDPCGIPILILWCFYGNLPLMPRRLCPRPRVTERFQLSCEIGEMRGPLRAMRTIKDDPYLLRPHGPWGQRLMRPLRRCDPGAICPSTHSLSATLPHAACLKSYPTTQVRAQ